MKGLYSRIRFFGGGSVRRAALFILIVCVHLAAQSGVRAIYSSTLSSSTPSSNFSSLPKVRAITAFVRLDRETYRAQIADALVVLRKAKARFESAGYEVETIRVTTQPLAELVSGLPEDQALAFLAQFDRLSTRKASSQMLAQR